MSPSLSLFKFSTYDLFFGLRPTARWATDLRYSLVPFAHGLGAEGASASAMYSLDIHQKRRLFEGLEAAEHRPVQQVCVQYGIQYTHYSQTFSR